MDHGTIYEGLRTPLSRKLFRRAMRAGFTFRNRPHWGAFKRGYVACIDGLAERHCPYIDPPNTCTWRRGLRTWWLLGLKFGHWRVSPDLYPKPVQAPPKTAPKPIAPAMTTRRIPRRLIPLLILALFPCGTYAYRHVKTLSDRPYAVNSQRCESQSRRLLDSLARNVATARDLARSRAWLTGRLVTLSRNQDRLPNRAELHPPTDFWGSARSLDA